MPSTSQTIIYRSRSGGQVRRALNPSKHLQHRRQKSAKPSLLRLPSELRLAIWEMVVDAPADKVYDFVKIKPPAVALVCSQMFSEAIPIFFSSRTWLIDVAAQLCPIKHDPLAFELFDPSVPMDTTDVLPNFPFTYDEDPLTPFPEPGVIPDTVTEHHAGHLPSMSGGESSESFARIKLAALRQSINELQSRTSQTVYTSSQWTAKKKQCEEEEVQGDPYTWGFPDAPCKKCTDFPLMDKMPWAVWSWIRSAESMIELKNVRLKIHFDKHVYGQHKLWKAGVSVLGGPEPKSSKSRCRVEWLPHKRAKSKKSTLSNLKENLLKKEMQYLLTATVSTIAQRRNFRGFTLAEMEILASVFLFEEWNCESESCYHCHGYGDPFWNLEQPPNPVPPPFPPMDDLATAMLEGLDVDPSLPPARADSPDSTVDAATRAHITATEISQGIPQSEDEELQLRLSNNRSAVE